MNYNSNSLLRSTAFVLLMILVLAPSLGVAKKSGDKRTKPVTLIIVHATGGPSCKCETTGKTDAKDCLQGSLFHSGSWNAKGILEYFERHEVLSIHFVLDRDGTLLSSIPTDQVAIHAGVHNRTSIGIELINDGDGHDPFPDPQIDALISLLKELMQEFDLDAGAVKGHSEVDERYFLCGSKQYKTKIDPGGEYPGSSGNFPWKKVRGALNSVQPTTLLLSEPQ